MGRPLEPAQRPDDGRRELERDDRALRHGGELHDVVRRARRHSDRRGGRQPAVALAHLRLLPEDPARHRVFDLCAGRADRHLARRRFRRLGQPASWVALYVHPRWRARDRDCDHVVVDGERAAAGNVRRRLACRRSRAGAGHVRGAAYALAAEVVSASDTRCRAPLGGLVRERRVQQRVSAAIASDVGRPKRATGSRCSRPSPASARSSEASRRID